MAEKKVIAVVGATGSQGGGLVRAILNDPNGGFSARAITRNPNSDGAKALAIFNFVTDDVPQPVTVSFKDLGFTGPVHARDLWAHTDLGTLSGEYTAVPPKGGVVMLRLWQ